LHILLAGASPDPKLWGGQQQTEPLKGVWQRSPQRGPWAPCQAVKLSEAESFLVLVYIHEVKAKFTILH